MYLSRLARRLEANTSDELAEQVRLARRHVSMSTESLGEARIALRIVAAAEPPCLTEQEREELTSVLRQLDAALDDR